MSADRSLLDGLLVPGTTTLLTIRHDDGCPALDGGGTGSCTCTCSVVEVEATRIEPEGREP